MATARECACSGRSLPRLLRPGIMAFLARGKAHGYQIAQHLSAMRMFDCREPDHPGVYRALKEMADEGLVTAAWEMGDSGPAKRTYALTEAGHACLDTWMATLCRYRAAVDELLALLHDARQ